MTIFWLALWVALSVFIIGVFVITTRALQDQKKAWGAFAAARKLSFEKGTYFRAATIRGTLNNHQIFVTSEERDGQDLKGRKFVTLLQFGLNGTMPAPVAVGTGEFCRFVEQLPAAAALPLTYPGWGTGQVVAKTDAPDVAPAYFTTERLRVIDTLQKQKGVSVLFLCDATQGYLRLETADPMLHPGQLDRVVDSVLPLLKVLAV